MIHRTAARPSILNVSRTGHPPSPHMMIAAPLPEDVSVSFEFFPPNSDAAAKTLWSSIKRLEPLRPSCVSVTYGAGGTTRDRTRLTVLRIARETLMVPAAHLTCIGASRDETDRIAQDYRDHGIRHIIALRGDLRDGDSRYRPRPDGYAYASDMVAGLRRIGDFEISVAAYPETHPEASSSNADLDNLKRKIDAGATRAITQFFFDPDVFLRFLERVRRAGISIPVIPGILPVTNFRQTVKFAAECGTNMPPWMHDLFGSLDDDMATRNLVAASVAAEQCRMLHANGVNAFHFYTMNKASLCYAICHIMGVRKDYSALNQE